MHLYKYFFCTLILGSSVLAMETYSPVEDALKLFEHLGLDANDLNNFTIINKTKFAVQIFVKRQPISDSKEVTSDMFQIEPCASDCMILKNSSEKIEAELVVGSAKKNIQIYHNATYRISKAKIKFRDNEKQWVNDIRLECDSAGNAHNHFFKIIRTRKNTKY